MKPAIALFLIMSVLNFCFAGDQSELDLLKKSNVEILNIDNNFDFIKYVDSNRSFAFLRTASFDKDFYDEYVKTCFIILDSDYEIRNSADDLRIKGDAIRTLNKIAEDSDHKIQEAITGKVAKELFRLRAQKFQIDDLIRQIRDRAYEKFAQEEKLHQQKNDGEISDVNLRRHFFDEGLEARKEGRLVYLDVYIPRAEKEFTQLVLRVARGKESIVYKYFKMAGYDRKEVPGLIASMAGRNKSTEFLFKKSK